MRIPAVRCRTDRDCPAVEQSLGRRPDRRVRDNRHLRPGHGAHDGREPCACPGGSRQIARRAVSGRACLQVRQRRTDQHLCVRAEPGRCREPGSQLQPAVAGGACPLERPDAQAGAQVRGGRAGRRGKA